MWTRAPRLAVAMAVAAMAAPVLFARAEQQAPPQAQKPPVFRSSVDLVRVDVSVVDNKGMPVLGLGVDDFKVFLDGRERRVVTAEMVTFDPPSTGGASSTDPIRTPGQVPEDARVFVLAIDQMGLAPGAISPVKDSVRRFLTQLRPEDMVGLYDFPFRAGPLEISHDRSTVVRGLDRVIGMRSPPNGSSFTLSASEIVDIAANDLIAFERAFSRECVPAGGIAADPMEADACRTNLRMEARMLALAYENEASQRMNELARLAQSLQFIPGRKTVVMVSNGLVSSNRPGGRPDLQSVMRIVGDDLANAQANLYVLHLEQTFMEVYSAAAPMSRRPADRFESMSADRFVATAGLEILAGRSGGTIFSVDAGTPDHVFDRLLRETAAYYVIGVEPADEDRDGKEHYIRVETTARGSTLRSRVQVLVPRR
jgi:VWFA-related protein